MLDQRLTPVWWALRIAYGVVPIVAGLDKFFNLLTNWQAYLNPLALQVIPISATAFMQIVGVVEILVGLAVLTRWTRVGAYVAAVWLVLIALNLITQGRYLDIAVRDLVMALGAYTLARLEEVRAGAEARLPHARDLRAARAGA